MCRRIFRSIEGGRCGNRGVVDGFEEGDAKRMDTTHHTHTYNTSDVGYKSPDG